MIRYFQLVSMVPLLTLFTTLILGCGSPASNDHAKQEHESARTESNDHVNPDVKIAADEQTATEHDDQSYSTTGSTSPTAKFDRGAELAKGDRLATQGNFKKAADAFRNILIVDPTDVEVLFRLANCQAAMGNLAEATKIVSAIPEDHPEAGLPATGQAADWLYQLERFDEAAQKYSKVLAIAPAADRARRRLAFILNRQGRRHLAAEHIHELCRHGNIRQDELHALALLSDAIYDAPTQIAAGGKSPTNHSARYTPIGSMGKARKHFADADYGAAADCIEQEVASGDAPADVVAFFGRAVAEAQDDQRFEWWLSRVNSDTKQHAEYWAAIGTLLVVEKRFPEAIHALLEAVDRDPTDLKSIIRLQTSFHALGRETESQKWSDRWKQVRDLVRANNRVAGASPIDVTAVAELAQLLFSAERQMEALMWKSIEGQARRIGQIEMSALNQQRIQLINAKSGFPSQAWRLCEMEISDFDEPKLAIPKGGNLQRPQRDSHKPYPAKFANVAQQVGLDHAFKVASHEQKDGFTIYQLAGGAVAALDYELDGHVDLCFAQGAADAPAYLANEPNSIYRNIDGQLGQVSAQANLREKRYTIGIAVGDWNQDGFPDVVFANIGENTLWINNGDGSFEQRKIDDRDDVTLMPASLAIADVNGDALPDLVEVNYVHDDDLARFPTRNEQGEVLQTLLPLSYSAGADRLVLNDPTGRPAFRYLETASAHAGLGLVVADLDGAPGNEIFVGNDLGPNQLWTRDTITDSWHDIATATGCAFGFSGAATASMGIAAGDFDGNGLLDLHVTNFQEENVSLFLRNKSGYRDRNVQFRLAKPSSTVLGFGTQAIDYDNDSRLDLVVANGHIENAVALNAPFQQPAQLFSNTGDSFQLIDVDDTSGYWQAMHLGRGLARLDFNRDGKNDFVITHLGETSAIMLNETDTKNHWLQIQLVGIESERGGTGARVTVRYGTRQQTQWLSAGDGYLCRNEPIVSFGLGDTADIKEIEVQWPSGIQQTYIGADADQRILVIENQPIAFRLSERT